MTDKEPVYRRMRYRVDDTPTGKRVVPIDPQELTPEQQAALVELGRKMVESMRVLVETFEQFGAACVEAYANIEAVDWQPDTPPEPGESP